MLRLTLKNLAANRLRFALTTFAVVLAVAFVVSSFVLTDGLRSSFNDLSSEIVGGTDYEIRPADEFGAPEVLDESVLAEVAAIDGVAAASPVVVTEETVRPITPSGEEISLDGPPQFAFGWIDEARLSNVDLVEGAAPDEPGEFSVDLGTAANHGFEVGERYTIIAPGGNTEATLVGIVRFGEENATLGATLLQFESGYLQQLRGEGPGYDAVLVALDGGADRGAVADALAAVAPDAEVVDQATLESEQRAEFNSGIDLINYILLGFAGVSLFVSVFIIYNTFAIVLGQRTRELGLLRTLGADPVQLQRSVRTEALIMGVIASLAGVAGGVGVAIGLRALFASIGATLVVVSLRTWLVAAAVGVGVTVLSALGPARKAARVSPVEAMRDGAAAGQAGGRSRLALGALLSVVGVVAGATGMFVASGAIPIVALLAVGAIAVFVGVTMVSPVLVGPITRVFGWPADAAFGVAGRLAHQNAGRNPQRTATTAAALMIGLALVSMVLTVGESAKAQLRATLESSVDADYIVDAPIAGTLPPALVTTVADGDIVDSVATFSYDAVEIDDDVVGALAVDFEALDGLFDLGIDPGIGLDPDVEHPVLVSNEEARAEGIAPGDEMVTTFRSGEVRTLTVIGVFADDIVAEEPYIIDLDTWSGAGSDVAAVWMAVGLVEGTDEEAAEAFFAPLRTQHQQVEMEAVGRFVENIEAQIDQLLGVVNAMVALAVIIALIGIANTLALSVFERTRELGLLRAVGMSRRQLRRMIRFEAALVALFGAATGVALGIFFGWAAVTALPSAITSTLAVPMVRILVLVAVAGAAGLVAAWGPARRAGRLDVLDAIAN
ncbi:MAG: ABC transporter permease [Actinomycetota bacterium]